MSESDVTHCPFAFMMPGLPELVIILAIILLLFGKRLPALMRSVGRSVVEFKKGVSDIEDDREDKDKKITE